MSSNFSGSSILEMNPFFSFVIMFEIPVLSEQITILSNISASIIIVG